MKNFFIFLLFSLLLIAGFIFYYIKNPKEGMIVRQDGKWVIIEQNITDK